ncbi:MAG: four helix bundle protein [Opitutae bacterium]
MKNEFEERTFRFALRVVKFIGGLPQNTSGTVIGRQLMKSGTAIGAIYHEAQRAESKADFVHKVTMSEKEAAETEYWLMLCVEAKLSPEEATKLLDESRQLLAIITTIGRKAKLTRT